MTENEAISMLEQGDKNANEADCTYEEYLEAIEMGRKALSEIQQYRAIGTVEEIQSKLEAYRELGTMEELKALKEKSVPKKPISRPNHDYTNEELVCPTCGGILGLNKHVCKCSQIIDL